MTAQPNDNRMTDVRIREAIEEMVRQEIRDVVAKHRATVDESVAALLIPELKMAIRESVHDALAALTSTPSLETAGCQSREGNMRMNGRAGSDCAEQAVDAELPRVFREENASPTSGAYVYCVAGSGEPGDLGNIGIDHNRVYTIPFRSLCAVIHDCPARAYSSEDPALVKGWVMAHQRVVDAAWERCDTVIPLGFDTIIRGDGDGDSETGVTKWLEDDYENLMGKIEKLRGKAEFVIQILWNKKATADHVAKESREIKDLTNEIASKPRGLAYMYRQKLEGLLRKEVENRVDRYFREFYDRIAPHVDDIRVEKTKKPEDPEQQMLLNLSCLLPREGSEGLGDELEKIDAMDGFSVRYTGPWPPYSFV
jgi:hypothetical protein